MAIIDQSSGALVIRIVYDGAPFAGKTTSIRALAAGLNGTVHSPGEIAGRTLYFDWLDYTGGLFEGRRIRCQIVSVPGQAVLAPRRRRLLRSADVVVYVSDGAPDAFSGERGYLEGLKTALARDDGLHVGIIVQANKRDVPGAVPLSALRDMVDATGVKAAIIETNAFLGNGIRETFVLAVRLALDRVREQMSTGRLFTQRPDIDSDIELLEDLKRETAGLESLSRETALPHTRLIDVENTPQAEDSRLAVVSPPILGDLAVASGAQDATLASHVLSQILAETQQTSAVSVVGAEARDDHISSDNEACLAAPTSPPLLPNDQVASGLIWPLVVGRTILSELTDQECTLERFPEGAWSGVSGGRWRLHSDAFAQYADLEQGRQDMVGWARTHVGLARLLSPDRSIVLSTDHAKTHRLWQVVRVMPTLSRAIEQALMGSTANLAALLLASTIAFRSIESGFSQAGLRLALTLNDVSITDVSALFVGDLPAPKRASALASERDACEASPPIKLETLLQFAEKLLLSRGFALLDYLEQPSLLMRRQSLAAVGADATFYSYVRQSSAERMSAAASELCVFLQRI